MYPHQTVIAQNQKMRVTQRTKIAWKHSIYFRSARARYNHLSTYSATKMIRDEIQWRCERVSYQAAASCDRITWVIACAVEELTHLFQK